MPDTNKIKYGLEKCYYAKATIASDGSATYAAPVALPGAVSLSMDQQSDRTPFWADNIEYWISNLNNGYDGELELAVVPESFLKDILGYLTDANNVILEDAGAEPAHFALLFQFQGDKNAKRHVLYNCVASRPNLESQTREDTITPQTESLEITATSVYNTSLTKDIVKARVTETETTAYNSWYSAVYQSTTLHT